MPTPPIQIPDQYIDNCFFDVIRPFNSGTVIDESGIGTLVDDIMCGRGTGGSNLNWTHTLYTFPSIDIRDGASRIGSGNALIYADGDELKVYMPFGYIRFVVVWVSYIKDNTGDPGSDDGYKAIRLMRHSVVHI